ncbi:MAG TPA: hypothetical protein VL171_04000 [Verrucomicrobiae bacterium]|nr:hypothetical protein [Verrucomicrobiae bacterium]
MTLNPQTIIAFVGGLGIGSIAVAIVNHLLGRKAKHQDAAFAARKEAIDGLLQAYRDASVSPTEEVLKRFGYWEAQINIVCSERLSQAVEKLKLSAPGTSEREEADREMRKAMRDELKLAS